MFVRFDWLSISICKRGMRLVSAEVEAWSVDRTCFSARETQSTVAEGRGTRVCGNSNNGQHLGSVRIDSDPSTRRTQRITQRSNVTRNCDMHETRTSNTGLKIEFPISQLSTIDKQQTNTRTTHRALLDERILSECRRVTTTTSCCNNILSSGSKRCWCFVSRPTEFLRTLTAYISRQVR